MISRNELRSERGSLVVIAAWLAGVVGLGYVLIALDVVPIGVNAPASMWYVAATCYVLGGLLILLRRRWLWVVGAFSNAFVLVLFVQLSPTGPRFSWRRVRS